MFDLLFIGFFGVMALWHARLRDDEFATLSRGVSVRLGGLWDIAHQGMRDNRLLKAEKALLAILKIDERNAAAYNRLGILYAKQKEYRDAIDCFEIASSIEVTPSALHNLGLIYYETENYEKADIAFQEALKLEGQSAARHVAYAKVQEKLGNTKVMFQELERATELEPNKETYTLLSKAYRSNDQPAEADLIDDKIKKLITSTAKPKRILRRPRVVI